MYVDARPYRRAADRPAPRRPSGRAVGVIGGRLGRALKNIDVITAEKSRRARVRKDGDDTGTRGHPATRRPDLFRRRRAFCKKREENIFI